jgi:hypothetical protein
MLDIKIPRMAEDLFDAALNLEDQLYEEGYKLGFEDGTKAGKIEGRSVGMAKGFDKFLESGRLYGKAVVWANRLPANSSRPGEQRDDIDKLPPLPENTRLEKNISSLHALMEPDTLSTENSDESVADFDDRLRKAQGKAKVIERLVGEKSRSE